MRHGLYSYETCNLVWKTSFKNVIAYIMLKVLTRCLTVIVEKVGKS